MNSVKLKRGIQCLQITILRGLTLKKETRSSSQASLGHLSIFCLYAQKDLNLFKHCRKEDSREEELKMQDKEGITMKQNLSSP